MRPQRECGVFAVPRGPIPSRYLDFPDCRTMCRFEAYLMDVQTPLVLAPARLGTVPSIHDAPQMVMHEPGVWTRRGQFWVSAAAEE